MDVALQGGLRGKDDEMETGEDERRLWCAKNVFLRFSRSSNFLQGAFKEISSGTNITKIPRARSDVSIAIDRSRRPPRAKANDSIPKWPCRFAE